MDDVLLAVLSYLNPRELLSCRTVCRRLRGLCLHKDLWRHVVVGSWHKSGEAAAPPAALKLAPCLGLVRGGGDIVEPISTLAHFVAGSACVVAGLTLTIWNLHEIAPATAVILKHAAQGGLKNLSLAIAYLEGEDVTTLLKAAYNTHGLERLCIQGKHLPDTWCEKEVLPCLSELVYVSERMDPFLLLLLKTHAATLEEVFLLGMEEDIPVSLLASMPSLRRLQCSPSEDMPLLLSLPLQVVALQVPSDEPFPEGALKFLGQASQLRSVSFYGGFSFGFCENPGAVLQALSTSFSARLLETLDSTLR